MPNRNGKMIGWKEQNKFGLECQVSGKPIGIWRGARLNKNFAYASDR